MKKYFIYRINLDNLLPYGIYEGRNKQDAVNNMAKSGNLTGSDFGANYFAIPYKTISRHFTPKIK